ncbi:LIG6 [Symbiodinium sp. CCMP2592]|nr:LIG6 [Symbiodinium sp. CCMP2592]
MAAAPRACVRCTLLCDDASQQACALCGGDLAPPQKFRTLNSPTCIDLEDDVTDHEPPRGAARSCPACTLICEDPAQRSCEACGGALPEPPTQPPRKRPKKSPKPIASQASGVATFFQKTATIPESKQEPPSSAEPPAPGCGPSLSPAPVAINTESAWSASVAAAALSTSCADFRPASAAGCWTKKGAPVPYRHLAAALDALEATRSRLSKDTILTNSFRVMLAMAAPAEEVESACYLFAPAKDAQAGGHRLRPDWVEGGRPLSIPHKSITASLLEATGASKADMNRLYQELHDSGQVALALRERGGKQRLLRAPQPLTAGAVRRTLLSLADLQGTGVEKAKTTRLVGLLRAAEGTELKWLVRTFMPHMAAGVSLESSVLPALGAAAAMAAGATADAVRSAQEEVRHGYALRPDVRALVEALLEDGIEGVRRRCTLHLGVPMQPMLAKACTSIQELLKRILKSVPRSVQATNPIMLSAEFKYDGQRAQIHVVPGGRVKIFSRKLDDMTYKYPDVVKAVLKSSRTQAACVLDAEIVAVVPKENTEEGTGEGKELERKDGNKVEIAAFQSLATRKRKNVTEANAATTSVAVKVFLFDLLFLAEEPLISLPFQQRRERLKESFAEVEDLVAYAEAEDLEGNAGSAEATLEAALQRSVAMSCEGLMVKHLDSGYEPSTKRSDCWLKLKKDYVESMGDSLDLVPIGGWRGSGRKSRWVSPWLLATYDPEEGTFGSVCRVMSGFSDQFYKENTLRYLGRELHVGTAKSEIDAEDEGEDADEDEVEVESAESAAAEEEDDTLPSKGLAGMQLRSKAGGVETLEQPQFWFQPSEVWEIRGADITISPKHLAAQGLVDPKRGLSLRFPRFIRKREDKRLDQATTPQQLAEFSLQQATPASRLTTTTETAENDSDDNGVCEGWQPICKQETKADVDLQLSFMRIQESLSTCHVPVARRRKPPQRFESLGNAQTGTLDSTRRTRWIREDTGSLLPVLPHAATLLHVSGEVDESHHLPVSLRREELTLTLKAAADLPGRLGESIETASLSWAQALVLDSSESEDVLVENVGVPVELELDELELDWSQLGDHVEDLFCGHGATKQASRFLPGCPWCERRGQGGIQEAISLPHPHPALTLRSSPEPDSQLSEEAFSKEGLRLPPVSLDELRKRCAHFRQSGSSRHICSDLCYFRDYEPARQLRAFQDRAEAAPALLPPNRLAGLSARLALSQQPPYWCVVFHAASGAVLGQSRQAWKILQQETQNLNIFTCAVQCKGLQDNATACGQRWPKDSLLLETVNQKMTEIGIHAKNQDLSACARQAQWTAAIQIFREVGKLNLQESAGTHSAAVNACGKAKIWERALQLWAVSAYRRSNIFLHGAGMSSMEKMGRWQDALAMLNHLGEMQLQANVVTASTAMSIHWHGTLLVLDHFMEQRLEPNVVMYTSAISACEFESCWNAALHLLHQLEATKVQANVHAYSAAIVACETGGQWQRALMLLSEVEQSRIEADAVIYNATISACGESGPWRAVVHLLSDMHMKQIRRDIVTFGAAIDSWKKSGCWQHAILQLADLQSIWVSPNLVIYNAALATCEKGGAWQAALSLLSDLRQLQLREDVATMGSLMSACVRCTQPDKALHLFSTFTGSRAEANAITYTAAIGACSRAQKWQQGLQWMTEIVLKSLQYDVLLYSAAISTCDTPMLWRKAEKLLTDLSDRDMEKTLVTLNVARQQVYVIPAVRANADDRGSCRYAWCCPAVGPCQPTSSATAADKSSGCDHLFGGCLCYR